MKRIGAAALLLALAAGMSGEVFYPWKEVYAGALDGTAWPGLVFASGRDTAFAFRLAVEKDGQAADSPDFFFIVAEVGPHSPDGQYARVSFDLSLPLGKGAETPVLVKPPDRDHLLTFEWSRRDERVVIGRIRCPRGIRLSIIHYVPWDLRGGYEIRPDGHVLGRAPDGALPVYVFWSNREFATGSDSTAGRLVRSIEVGKDRDIHFAAALGTEDASLLNQIYRYKNATAIDNFLREEEDHYARKRVRVDGLYRGAPEAITNNLFWSVLYQPGQHRLYAPAGRRWLFPRRDGAPDHWQVFEWDAFFSALLLSVENSKLALDTIAAVLQTQYPNGNIPNWRSRTAGTPDRSQPPVGSYVVLKLFQKLGDMDLLRFAAPYLERWHAFWTAVQENDRPRRDGNGDGLLEWGSDAELLAADPPDWEKDATLRQRAAWESGQDDLPNWDEAGESVETGTLSMNCLDLNCLYALDAHCLAEICQLLGRPADAARYAAEYERMRTLVNQVLWDEQTGFYYDRHWDGRFSRHKAASNFFPLVARIPDERRARRIVQHLLNPREFWGDYVIPSISRDDPAFRAEDQQYWRGTIWPPTNYLVHQGLRAYGFDVLASELAFKSAAMFLRSWTNFQLCPENFDSLTGEPGGQRHQSWGPLLLLSALEEYIDFTPWEGFRFGMLEPRGKGRAARLAFQGRHYDVEISRKKTALIEEGREILSADRAAVFRRFLYNEREVSFDVKGLERVNLKLRLLVEGRYQLLVDGREHRVFRGDRLKFRVPEGSHSVLIQLLEEIAD